MFYFYQCWEANLLQAHIHRAECADCQDGSGGNGSAGDPCHWSAPFGSYAEARNAACHTGGLVSNCRRCEPHCEQAEPV